MKKQPLLHDKCQGLVETFKGKNYGLCQECGTEGYFEIVKTEDDVKYVAFKQVTVVRK